MTRTLLSKGMLLNYFPIEFKPIFVYIRFRRRNREKDYIYIVRGGDCESRLGKIGGKQHISLGHGCANGVGTPMHEFMHALGKTR